MVTLVTSSSKREKMPWTKFRKRPGLKEKEKVEHLFIESRRKELENKAYPSKFTATTTFCFGLHLADWMFCSLEVATTFLLFR